MYFIGRRKLRSESMTSFKSSPEFARELAKLAKKYRSLTTDLSELEEVIRFQPVGRGKNFVVLYQSAEANVVKTRLFCDSLKSRDIRVIYAYHKNTYTFLYIEIYFKGQKETEDKLRIAEYLKTL